MYFATEVVGMGRKMRQKARALLSGMNNALAFTGDISPRRKHFSGPERDAENMARDWAWTMHDFKVACEQEARRSQTT